MSRSSPVAAREGSLPGVDLHLMTAARDRRGARRGRRGARAAETGWDGGERTERDLRVARAPEEQPDVAAAGAARAPGGGSAGSARAGSTTRASGSRCRPPRPTGSRRSTRCSAWSSSRHRAARLRRPGVSRRRRATRCWTACERRDAGATAKVVAEPLSRLVRARAGGVVQRAGDGRADVVLTVARPTPEQIVRRSADEAVHVRRPHMDMPRHPRTRGTGCSPGAARRRRPTSLEGYRERGGYAALAQRDRGRGPTR